MNQFVIITEQNITVLNPIEIVHEFVASLLRDVWDVSGLPEFYRFCDNIYIPRNLD